MGVIPPQLDGSEERGYGVPEYAWVGDNVPF